MSLKGWTDYHPYAACLMMQACEDGAKVRANLDAVVEYGRQLERKQSTSASEQQK
jgi:hypothetical protein